MSKILMIITHSTDNHDKANIALAFAASMLSDEHDLAIAFIFEGVLLAKEGIADTIAGNNMTPAKDLMPLILEENIPLYVCAPCAQTHGVAEEDLIPGAKIVSAPTVVAEMEDRKIVNF